MLRAPRRAWFEKAKWKSSINGTYPLSSCGPTTSDHRVAGPSPTGCKSSLRADWRRFQHCKRMSTRNAVIRFCGGRCRSSEDVRITPNILDCLDSPEKNLSQRSPIFWLAIFMRISRLLSRMTHGILSFRKPPRRGCALFLEV